MPPRYARAPVQVSRRPSSIHIYSSPPAATRACRARRVVLRIFPTDAGGIRRPLVALRPSVGFFFFLRPSLSATKGTPFRVQRPTTDLALISFFFSLSVAGTWCTPPRSPSVVYGDGDLVVFFPGPGVFYFLKAQPEDRHRLGFSPVFPLPPPATTTIIRGRRIWAIEREKVESYDGIRFSE